MSAVGGPVSGRTPGGMDNVQLHPPYFIWRQPAGPNGQPDPTVQPGTFDCAYCYYNLDTGQGGRIAGLENLPHGDWRDIALLALDQADPTRLLVQDNSRTPPSTTSTNWLINLTNGAQQALPATVPNFFVGTTLLTGDTIAGAIAGQQSGSVDLVAYRLSTGTVHPVSHAGGWLQTDGTALFWQEAAGIRRMNLVSGQAQAVPNTTGAATFTVASDRIALATLGDARTAPTLTVRQLSTGALLLQAPLGPKGAGLTNVSLSLSGDTLLIRTDRPERTQVQVAWLVAPDPAFAQVWTRADGPVAAGKTSRTWLWGPQPLTLAREPYAQAPGGTRLVEYYDKSRMEVNNPAGNPADPYYVTNGLLVAEMIGGQIQTGDSASISATVPCTIPVAGDLRTANPLTPGYAALAGVASLHGDHQAADRTGQAVDDTIDVEGVTGKLPTANAGLAHYAAFMPQTGHNIPDVFQTYLRGMQATYGFDWTFVLGYPITEGYWTQMRVGGKDYPVLLQAYQRRVLTYAPDFAPEWRVQQGNVGQHYLEWRYRLNNLNLP
jgi:hypothetical protein